MEEEEEKEEEREEELEDFQGRRREIQTWKKMVTMEEE